MYGALVMMLRQTRNGLVALEMFGGLVITSSSKRKDSQRILTEILFLHFLKSAQIRFTELQFERSAQISNSLGRILRLPAEVRTVRIVRNFPLSFSPCYCFRTGFQRREVKRKMQRWLRIPGRSRHHRAENKVTPVGLTEESFSSFIMMFRKTFFGELQ